MTNPVTFIFPAVLVALIVLCISWLAGSPSAPKPDKDAPTETELALLRELREMKRRLAIEKGGSR